ncbi:carboxypeptidase-like regulatory domain-containing protein [Sediminibacterium soli]|uniref:carboxypeptidase-like regulatory domain-containing protein n=1 Tax=Sediminibacterium soli TaxID=2698829 RepID=UPI001379A9AA|nr:carboxypeptidase-like regulatory domain-containing protein [Sediminibacterium soli]NCI47945.1 hypothetical protein [Sediminibacterium soli]
MKKHVLLISFILCSFLSARAFTFSVVVKGYIRDSSGYAVANKAVRIFNNDSTNTACQVSHTVYTNPNGYYIDTVSCTNPIGKLLVVVEDCKGQRILRDAITTSVSNTIEVNFKLCTVPGTVSCKAYFRDTLTPNGVKFMSQWSFAPAGDSIIGRTWYFGDTTRPLTGNRVDPTHYYSKPGIYSVCLAIRTKNGCENKYCTTITIKDNSAPPATCKAYFTDSTVSNGIRFNSKHAYEPVGDSIISRTWYFGDSSQPLTGNRVDPTHYYSKPGIYNVCLAIRTKNGCENKYCTTITVKDSRPVNCKAYFTYSFKDSVVYFNSAGSSAPDGDSIISRTWYYTDVVQNNQLVLQGNVIDTFIRYAIPGNYTVYLVIRTRKGCESKTAVTVVIPARPAECTLQPRVVIHERVGARKFRFSSSMSTAAGDSIISRKWKFGDGTAMDGNEISPLKEYRDTGVYAVCVLFKTKKGCEKEVFIVAVVKDSTLANPPATGCKAVFTFSTQDRAAKFNSSGSVGTTQQDSIISRTWLFGDSTQPVTGSVDPLHVYAKAGTYTVYLYIKTKSGCESKYAATVTIAPLTTGCQASAQFTATRVSPKKVQFNSLPSSSAAGDSIVQRKWKFGDGTVLEGNAVSPVKEYPFLGIYNACLTIKTARGCAAETCKQVTVQDTTGLNESAINFVKIIAINPNPVVTRMLVTIWSRNANTEVEIGIIDIYGAPKMSIKKVLSQGNNIIEIPVANLYRGPYFLRVSSRGSKDSKMFYKL